jgi:hypothetical protein
LLKFVPLASTIQMERIACERNAEMQIDKTQNIQPQNIIDPIAPKEANRKPTGQTSSDVTIDTRYQEYASQALNNAGTDDTAEIEQARKLLASGALDTPEAARKAAENLLKFGI